MPAHHFMLADIAGCMAGVCLFPLFVLVPGYAIAWLTDLFDFRRRTFAFRLALSIPLAIAICPTVTYFAGRFGSMSAVWAFYAASWIYTLAVAAGRPMSLAPYLRPVVIIFIVWTAIAILSLIDLQVGARAWYPSAAFDYSVRTQFIQSIGATGIPPANPFFFPGHAVSLRYHYFWLLLCYLVDLAGGTIVTARHAWIAGTVWCGFGLMALVAVYFRLFSYRGAASFQRRAIAGILLLGVTGLDILPTAVLWLLQAAGMPAVRPSMEWWNEQVDGFVYTALWESHYLSGLIACLMAFLILWSASHQAGLRARISSALLAGISLACGLGASVYVAFVFGLFLLLWLTVLLAKRRWRESVVPIGAGLVGVALALPFAISLRGPALGGPALEFWIRPFSPLQGFLQGAVPGKPWVLPVANALALPLNYFLELGFFLAAALLWWKRRRASGRPLTPAESATSMMIATSITVCTFLRSSVIGNNDLGWRGFLIAQFGLLLLAVDILLDLREQRKLLVVLLLFGAIGSAYEVGINRFYPLLADLGTVPTFSWLGPDRRAGQRIYALREAGDWLEKATGPAAIVQFNPHVAEQNTSARLYFGRPEITAGESLIAFGGDPALGPPLIAELNRVYPPAGQVAEPDIASVCRALPISFLAAIDTDPAWSDRHSWVWTQEPAFANASVRLFRCR